MSPENKPNNNSSESDIAKVIANFHRKLSRALKLISFAEELMDEINCDFNIIIKAVSGASFQGGAHSISLKKWSQRSTEHFRLTKLKAQEGVMSIKLVPMPNKYVRVHFDGRSAVLLSPMLANMFRILISPGQISHDHLIGWKSVSEIRVQMRKATGKDYSKHAIGQLVYRLREHLEKSGENRFYVMSGAKRGHRFALQRGVGRLDQGAFS